MSDIITLAQWLVTTLWFVYFLEYFFKLLENELSWVRELFLPCFRGL